jgi:signal transduction histidine kinase
MSGSLPRLVTRLTLLHTGLFLASGVILLVIADVPLLTLNHTRPAPAAGAGAAQLTSNLPEVLRYSAIALVALALLSVVLGRLTAVRALRPLRTRTASARAISASDLPGRLRIDASYAEFTELADTLDDLARRLAEAFDAQRHFVANASHELRTPVAAQRTLLQVTLADPDATAASLRSACEQALALGEHQENLISALLTLAEGERGLERWEPVDLADVARTVLEARDDVRLRASLSPAVVAGDPHLIASLVTNLVDNALRHNVPGGTAEITVADGSLSVSNTGPVISPAEVERLFQPFHWPGADRTGDSDGHGLGLAIVTAIASAHRAVVTTVARPHGGLDITVRFPT